MGTGYSSKAEIREMFEAGRDLSKVNRIPPKENTHDESCASPKRVGVYCRVSTDGISQTVSFELQKKYYIKYVKNHEGWILKCLYSDEGISATSIKRRDGLLRMIDDAKAGVIDLVVVKNISRLSRNLKDSLRIISELKALTKPVGIYFESEHLNTLDPAMELIIRVLSILAEEESKKKSEAITASVRQRFEEGYYLVQPVLGYKRVGVNRIDIDEAEAETVRLIYDMYLAGYGEKKIAETLIELGLRKHSHHYVDGRVREGGTDWNGASVLNVLSNEKRCGDVNAQKTYTFDCIDHIVRKNERNVPQYYARDQHPAIITREAFYLGLKIKEANRGGWDKGIPVLKTYTNGTLKGYVRTIPDWYGFGNEDYMLAALKANDIDVEELSIYPDYVFSESYKMSSAESQSESFRYYEVSEKEFNTDPIITNEEYKLLKTEEPTYIKVFNELQDLQGHGKCDEEDHSTATAAAWMFSSSDKPVVTIDKRGISFNKKCLQRLQSTMNDVSDFIEVWYNPVNERIMVRLSQENGNNCHSILWIRRCDGKICMHRCSAKGLCKALYDAMGWNPNNKYLVIGSGGEFEGKPFLEFDLKCTIVKAYVHKGEKEREETAKPADISRLELLREEARNSGAYYEADDDVETYVSYITGKVESKSRAVYFEIDSLETDAPVSIADYEDEKYDPEFIKALLEKGVVPIEGWSYLNGTVTWTHYGFCIPSKSYMRSMGRTRSLIGNAELSAEPSITADYGWTTNYRFPTFLDVEERIRRIKEQRKNAAVWRNAT